MLTVSVKSSLKNAASYVKFCIYLIISFCSILSTNAGAATVTLTWDAVSSSDISGHKVHYGTSSGQYLYSIDVGKINSCSISGLGEGKTYYFAATSYNTSNIESNYSEEVVYRIPVTSNNNALVSNSTQTSGTILFEAEDGSIGGPMSIASDKNASTGGYISVPNGAGRQGYAQYKFSISEPGEYLIWGRVLAANGEDNSFFVSIDGGESSLWDTQISSNWIWDQVSDRNGADPVVYFLDKGEHTLLIEQREDGTKIDKILITNDLKAVPRN